MHGTHSVAVPAKRHPFFWSVGKVGRNQACPCGSGRKFKACHLAAQRQAELEARAAAEKERAR